MANRQFPRPVRTIGRWLDALAVGAASITPFPAAHPLADLAARRSDDEALASDLQAVGDDLRAVLRDLESAWRTTRAEADGPGD